MKKITRYKIYVIKEKAIHEDSLSVSVNGVFSNNTSLTILPPWGESRKIYLPTSTKPGLFTKSVKGKLLLCRNGYHLTTVEYLYHWWHAIFNSCTANELPILFEAEEKTTETVYDPINGVRKKKIIDLKEKRPYRSIRLTKHITPTIDEVSDFIYDNKSFFNDNNITKTLAGILSLASLFNVGEMAREWIKNLEHRPINYTKISLVQNGFIK